MLKTVFGKTLFEKRWTLLWWALSIFATNVAMIQIFPPIKEAFSGMMENIPSSLQGWFGTDGAMWSTIEGFVSMENWNLQIRTVLFVDEIHRFNKAQQDTFLPHVESGLILLIGATTENPSFEVIAPLISRLRVIVLEQLSKNDVVKILQKAIKSEKVATKIKPEAVEYLAEMSSGDARMALGGLEVALGLIKNKEKITKAVVEQALGRKMPRYDKKGDAHYDIISAFIKSMRAGEVDAVLYYLARMLAAGEDPKFIARRMVIFASEDIGLAGNGALNLSVSCFQAVERIGLPECKYGLFHTATALARSQKSREITDLMSKFEKLAADFPDAVIPLHIRNGETKLMKDLGYGKGYEWKAGFKHDKNYLPDEVAQQLNKFEK